MHICLVTPSFPPMVDGGVAIATGRLAAGLTRRGHQITVLTAPPTGDPAPSGAAMGPEALTVVYHDVWEPLHEPSRLAELCDRICRRHEQQPFDVILAYFIYPSGYLAVCLGETLGLPVVCSCRGNDISKDMFVAPDILDRVLRQSTRLVFVSPSLLDMADTLAPCRHKASVVANSVDCTQFQPLSRQVAPSSHPVVLGTSGLMRWKKGIDLLLPLIRGLHATHNIRFHLAGYGLDEAIDNQITSFLTHHHLQDRVVVLGPLPHHQMPQALRQMDIYITTSYQEGMPNGVLEAMACALPVVATAADGIPELVQEGITGHLCPMGDLEALLASCRDFIEQPLTRRRMGAAGRARAQHHFHPERELAAVEVSLQLALDG
jgi:glycosyltransferase involved in cell wall biosynthesis